MIATSMPLLGAQHLDRYTVQSWLVTAIYSFPKQHMLRQVSESHIAIWTARAAIRDNPVTGSKAQNYETACMSLCELVKVQLMPFLFVRQALRPSPGCCSDQS